MKTVSIVTLPVARLLAFLIAFSFVGAAAQDRVALVIGNSQYSDFSPLDNPRQNHALMSRLLKELGFHVEGGLDLTTTEIRAALKSFSAENAQAKEVVVYFSGHGFQAFGEEFLAGVDSSLAYAKGGAKENEPDRSKMVGLVEVLEILGTMGDDSSVRVVFLDCCRDVPPGLDMAAGNALAQTESADGFLVAFAARAGQTARQSAPGGCSPYANALAESIREEPNRTIEAVLKAAHLKVARQTDYKQTPSYFSMLSGDLILNRGSAPTSQTPKPPASYIVVYRGSDGVNVRDTAGLEGSNILGAVYRQTELPLKELEPPQLDESGREWVKASVLGWLIIGDNEKYLRKEDGKAWKVVWDKPGDGFVSMRAGKSVAFPRVAKVNTGTTVIEVERHGKYLLARFDGWLVKTGGSGVSYLRPIEN